MMNCEKFVLYKDYDFKNKKAHEKITMNEKGLISHIIFDRVLIIDIYYMNGNMRRLDEVTRFDYGHNGEIIITNQFFDPSVYNMQFESSIEKIKIIGSAIDLDDDNNMIYFSTVFNKLELLNIEGGFNTESDMTLTLRDRTTY